MKRIPIPGEVWSSKKGLGVAQVDKVFGDDVAYTFIANGEGSNGLLVDFISRFVARYAPPAEPWEHPEPVEVWASIQVDGSLLVLSDAYDHGQVLELASYYRRPAICRVLVTPLEGSVERVAS